MWQSSVITLVCGQDQNSDDKIMTYDYKTLWIRNWRTVIKDSVVALIMI